MSFNYTPMNTLLFRTTPTLTTLGYKDRVTRSELVKENFFGASVLLYDMIPTTKKGSRTQVSGVRLRSRLMLSDDDDAAEDILVY